MMTKLTVEKVKQVCRDRGFEPLFDNYVCSKNKVLVRCQCGKEFMVKYDSIRSQKTKTCGHCNDPKIGDRFNSLVIIDTRPSKSNGCSVKCRCDCGKELNKWYTSSIITDNDTTSCGHCNDPQIGDKFGRLTIIEIYPSKGGSCRVVCMCECGRICYPHKYSHIVTNSVVSCGNCKLIRNGRFTSHTALQLHDIIERLTQQKWEHNYDIKGIGCIDIVQPDLKIAIEYDGYYNHKIRDGDHTKKDSDKIKRLVKSGWKVLHIKSGGYDMPTEKQLRKILLNDFQHGATKRTITMKSWKAKEKEKLTDKI